MTTTVSRDPQLPVNGTPTASHVLTVQASTTPETIRSAASAPSAVPSVSTQPTSTTPATTPTAKSTPGLNLAGAVSPSISKSLRQKYEKKLKVKRIPHPAAFRGWKEVAGYENGDQLTDRDQIMDLLTRSTFLEQYLPEWAYGDWYHIVAIMILGSLLSWTFGHFGFFLGPVFFVTLVVALYYRTSIRKYRQSIRIEAQREFSVGKIEDDFESLDWLNVFLEKLWPAVEPFASEQVCEQANKILAEVPGIPEFVKQVWIHTFTVGSKPPRVEKVRTLGRTADDVTVMDWWVSFHPNAKADMTEKQLKNRTNQTVIVKAKLFGLTLPVYVSEVSFQAKIRVRLRMMSNFPHIQTVNVSLMEAPFFDAVTKPIGGDSVFFGEVFSIPGLWMFINEMIVKFAGPMLFSPLSFQLNLEQLLAGNGLTGAIGILELTVKNASGLKGADTFNNTIDPYFTFGFGGKVLGKTKVVPDTMDPVYNEKISVILSTVTEPLAIMLYDDNANDGRKDKFMGATLYDLEQVLRKGTIPDITLPIMRNNRPAGNITLGMRLMRSLAGSKLPDGSYSPPPDLNTGVLHLKLLGARSYTEEDVKKKKLNAVSAEVFVNRKQQMTSGLVKNSEEASWALDFEDMVTDRSHCNVRVVLKDANKAVLGSATLRLTDIIDATYVGNEWFPMNRGIGEVKLSCEWNSVHMSGVAGSIGYTEPIGVVRVFIKHAKDLLNLEKIGNVDPYFRIMVNGAERGRTLAKESTQDPVFNEAIWVPVSSPNQRLTIEAMDVERNTPDRTLGLFQVRLDKLVDYDDKGEPIETVGEDKKGVLVHPRRGPHGRVSYSLSFFPCEGVRTPVQVADRKEKVTKLKTIIDTKKEKKESAAAEEDELAELQDEKPKTELTVDKLHNHNTGIIVMSIIDGKFSKDGYVQVFFDLAGYAAMESTKVGPRHPRVGLTGDAMIKELNDYSVTTIRYVSNKGQDLKKPAISEITMPTMQFLANCYDEVSTLTVAGSATCQIRIRTRFIPVNMTTLAPEDSIGNSGQLFVKVLGATGLPAGDSNGKSDPFTVLYLNGKEQFRTKTKKKTLTPEWNEQTEINIDDRVGSALRIKVNDWDFGVENDDELCEYTLPLADINAFSDSWQDLQLQLADTDNKPAGQIALSVLYKPAYHTVLSAQKGLPNVGGLALDGAGAVVGGAGKVVGGVAGGAGKVVGTAGKGVGKVVGAATGIFRKKH